jgi:Uma2 family endonuclease
MPVASPAPVEEMQTVEDLLKRLGDVPPGRIRLRPPPGTATEEDVLEAEARTGRLCELVDGTLVEKAMGYYESRLAVVLIAFLEAYRVEQDLGIVLGADGLVRMEPGQVRLPDVCFFAWEKFPNRLLPRGAILDRRPDLAVEILSPSNTRAEMARKRREYFAGGARLVWEVNPEARRVRVYTAPDTFTEVGEEGSLDGGPVLPGLVLSVRRWFERAGERAEP